jgi:AAA15 family ATPase/GTPase
MSNKDHYKFTINNFRIFNKPYTFELAPITILTGPNNSGKSSFVKALLMLKNEKNTEEIPFRINLPNKSLELPGVNDLLYAVDDSVDFNFSNLHHNLQFSLSLKRDLDFQADTNLYFDSIAVRHNNKVVLDIDNEADYIFERILVFDFRFWIGYFRRNLSSHKYLTSSNINRDNFNDFIKKYENAHLFELEQEDELLGEISLETKLKFIEIQNQLIDNTVDINEHNFDKHLKKHIGEYKMSLLERNQYKQEITESSILTLFEERLQIISIYIRYELLRQINIQIPGNFNLKETELYHHFEKFGKDFIESIGFELSKFTNIDILPISKANSSRYFQPDDFNLPYISKIVMNFDKSDDHLKRFWFNKWLNSWLIKFELGKKMEVINFANRDIYTIEIIDLNDNRRNIKDLGFGVSQIVSLLLSPFKSDFQINEYESELKQELIIDKSYFYDKAPVFYLEEPESNLHPSWQSLLMELITEINQKFGIRFIIETHSEYMIRKLQNLVSKKTITKDDVKLYYFNSDKNVTEEEPKIKEMILREDGIMATSFGPGFFDEAVKLTVELLKIENYN